MKEPYREGIANHPDPESCAGGHEAVGEALDRGTGRQGIELRNQSSGVPTLFREGEGQATGSDRGERPGDPAQSKTPGMPGNSRRENRRPPQRPRH